MGVAASEGPVWVRLLSHKSFVPVVVVAGVVLRMLVAVFIPVEPMSDYAWYLARAAEINAGLGYQEGGFPTAYWPVGWPAILALGVWVTGSEEVTVVALNVAAASVTMLLSYWYGRNVLGSELVGRLALLGYAVYPNHIAYSGQAATEPLYTALLMGSFALLIKHREKVPWLVLTGTLFGLATLMKPQTLAFPLGAIVALLWVYRDFRPQSALRAIVLTYCGLLVVVMPWTVRNLSVLGEPVLVSTNGGTALLLGANDSVTGTHFEYQDTEVFAQFGIPWEQRVERQVELNSVQKKAAYEWIASHPTEYLAWMPRKVFMLWRKDTDGFWSFDYSYPSATGLIRGLQIFNMLYYGVVLVAGLAVASFALVGLLRQREWEARLGLLYCVPVFVSLLAAGFTGQIRYHYSAMPYLILAAAWLISRAPVFRTSPPAFNSRRHGAFQEVQT